MPACRTIPLFALRPLLASLLFLSLAPRAAAAQPPPTRPDTVFFFRVCPHDGDVNVSKYKCPDSLKAFRVSAIKSVSLTIRLKDNSTHTQTFDPGTDALFLSNIAIEKFLLPYYVGVNDTEKAAALGAFLRKVATADSLARRPRAPRPRP